MIDPPPTTVIRLGGSLLGLPDLPARLADVLGDFSRPRPILIVGGGEPVECLRRWDRLYGLGEETCHWLALRVLSIHTGVVEQLAPDLAAVDVPGACPALWQRGKTPVLDSHRFIADVDAHAPDPMPRRWRVTSDSIAARIATTLGAPEVVLLKSTTFPPGLSTIEAAAKGLVDPHFPTAARDVERIVSVNLRDDSPAESVLVQPPAE